MDIGLSRLEKADSMAQNPEKLSEGPAGEDNLSVPWWWFPQCVEITLAIIKHPDTQVEDETEAQPILLYLLDSTAEITWRTRTSEGGSCPSDTATECAVSSCGSGTHTSRRQLAVWHQPYQLLSEEVWLSLPVPVGQPWAAGRELCLSMVSAVGDPLLPILPTHVQSPLRACHTTPGFGSLSSCPSAVISLQAEPAPWCSGRAGARNSPASVQYCFHGLTMTTK